MTTGNEGASPAAQVPKTEVSDELDTSVSSPINLRTNVPDPPSLVVREPTVEDKARVRLAYFFAGIFAVTILFACVAVLISHSTWVDIKDLLAVIMPAETALLGSATGFYFGAKK